jgi:MFS family permease
MALADYAANSPESSLAKPIISVSPWVILGVLMAGEYVILLDTTMVNVAIPSLTSSLHAGLSQVVWVLNAYMLIFGVLLIGAGRLGDIFGPKKLYLAGMMLFTAASLACGLSQTPNQLIAFRIVQAIGGALLTTQPGTIITSLFPPEKRGQAFGIMAISGGCCGLTRKIGESSAGRVHSPH